MKSVVKGPPPPGEPDYPLTPVPVGLQAVYTAKTRYTDALAVRSPEAPTTYFCASQHTPHSYVRIAATLQPPSAPAAATWTGLYPAGRFGEGTTHFFGYARDDVAVVLLRTPDNREHPAPVAAGIWWTPAHLDEPTARAVESSTWRAVAIDGTLLAHGTGPSR